MPRYQKSSQSAAAKFICYSKYRFDAYMTIRENIVLVPKLLKVPVEERNKIMKMIDLVEQLMKCWIISQ